MNAEQERAAFEWWASDEGESPRATERVGGGYKLAQIQSYWMAWQARAALQSPEVQAWKRDAERYRWLRNNANSDEDGLCAVRIERWNYGEAMLDLLVRHELDEAIDAARAAGGE